MVLISKIIGISRDLSMFNHITIAWYFARCYSSVNRYLRFVCILMDINPMGETWVGL